MKSSSTRSLTQLEGIGWSLSDAGGAFVGSGGSSGVNGQVSSPCNTIDDAPSLRLSVTPRPLAMTAPAGTDQGHRRQFGLYQTVRVGPVQAVITSGRFGEPEPSRTVLQEQTEDRRKGQGDRSKDLRGL